MKRRDFLKKAGIIAAGLPLVCSSGIAKNNQSTHAEEVYRTSTIIPHVNTMGVNQSIKPRCPCLHFEYANSASHVERGFCNWDGIAKIMEEKCIEMCVISKYPGSTPAEKFSRQFPGRVVLCTHTKKLTFPLMVDKDTWTATILNSYSPTAASNSFWSVREHTSVMHHQIAKYIVRYNVLNYNQQVLQAATDARLSDPQKFVQLAHNCKIHPRNLRRWTFDCARILEELKA